MKSRSLSLTISGRPIPKARARTAGGHTYTPKRTKVAEEEVALRLLAAMGASTLERADPDSCFKVEVVFYLPDFKRCDVDNLAKLILDAANGIVWKDDMQVVEIHAYVVRGVADTRTDLTISTVPNPHTVRTLQDAA